MKALAITVLLAASAAAAPVAKPGLVCPHCSFAGADLTNQCVKGGDLRGADFARATLVLACMSKADFRGADFRDADLSGANLSDSRLAEADLTGAKFSATQARGTDFAMAKGLTQAQLDGVCGDQRTRLPAGLSIKPCD